MKYLKDWRLWAVAFIAIGAAFAVQDGSFGLAVFVGGLMVWVFGE